MVHGGPDRLEVVFDDERAVANAGLLVPVSRERSTRPSERPHRSCQANAAPIDVVA